MLKTAVYLAGFYLVFILFLRKDTRFSRNRAFLLIAVLASFGLPSIILKTGHLNSLFYLGKTLSEIIVTGDAGKLAGQSATVHSVDIQMLIVKIYFCGIIVLGLKLFSDLIILVLLIKRNKTDNNKVIYCNGFKTSGFSAMGYIFLDKSLENEEVPEIVDHERNHIEFCHFIDILLVQLSIILQWFNPFIYLIDRSLREIHEFQADQSCLRSGIALERYQNLLLSNVFRVRKIVITNSFSNPAFLKRRMIMMLKRPSSVLTSLKVILALPVVAALLFIISAFDKARVSDKSDITDIIAVTENTINIYKSPVYKEPAKAVSVKIAAPSASSIPESKPEIQTVKEIKTENAEMDGPTEIFVVVEEMPAFPGGDVALMKFINENIKYPEAAKTAGITGRVILRFAVLYNGKVANTQVLKGVNPDLDNEAIRVVNSLPDWTPGRQGGKAVNVWYSVPITFQLK
jgi:TonB family protein